MPLFIPVISRGKTEAHLPVKYLLSAGCGLPDEYSVNQHPSFFSSSCPREFPFKFYYKQNHTYIYRIYLFPDLHPL